MPRLLPDAEPANRVAAQTPRAAATCTRFLNSEEDFRNANNFTIFIDKASLAKFKEAKIDDPAAHFQGKMVQVQGKVTLYRDRPEIKLSGPEAIKVVEQK
jgi:hypothetical protein